jgi:hypothetical protein
MRMGIDDNGAPTATLHRTTYGYETGGPDELQNMRVQVAGGFSDESEACRARSISRSQ